MSEERSARRGRRAGKPDTKKEILSAARDLFLERGYENTSVRAIARHAQVDPALVHHYFGNKRGLFLALVNLTFDPTHLVSRVLDGDRATMGRRIVATALETWESASARLLRHALLADPKLLPTVGGFVSQEVLQRVVSFGAKNDFSRRAAGIETQMMGLFAGRYITQIEPLASLPHDDVVRLIGPVVQHFLTAELRGPVRRSHG